MNGQYRRRGARTRWHPRPATRLLPMVSLLALLAGVLTSFGAVSAAPALQSGTAYVEVHVAACPAGYGGGNYFTDCHGNGLSGITVSLSGNGVNASKATTVPDTPGPGIAHFPNLAQGSYQVSIDVPADSNSFHAYCSIADGDTEVPVSPNDANSGSFTIPAGHSVVCDWYVIPNDQTQAKTTAAPLATQATKASIAVTTWTCPSTESADATYDTLKADCATKDPSNTLTLTDANGNPVTSTTDGKGTTTWSNLDPGNYQIAGSIGGEFATPVLYCVADGGNPYKKTFDNQLRSTFVNLATEQIVCDWYSIPANLKGQTGSLTVHLGVCPVGYTGSDFYNDCHNNGAKGQVFTLTGSRGNAVDATTTLPNTPGPGVAQFNDLDPDTYTLSGGVPGEFAKVAKVYCTDQAAQGKPEITVQMGDNTATFAIEGGQAILCDWYVVPENLSGLTPTVAPTTPATVAPTAPATVPPTIAPTVTATATATPKPTEPPQKASILVTMYQCPTASSSAQYAGASYGDLQADCTSPMNDVPLSLQADGGAPITAKTGASGPGALRFYDLTPATYTLTASLNGTPDSYMFCSIKGGNTYQKNIQNNSTVFQDLQNEQISCDWFVVPITPATQPPTQAPATLTPLTPQPTQTPQPSGPTGSITVREFLCGKDASQIKDWERECKAGPSGSAYTLTSSDNAINKTGTPDNTGVLVFNGLPDGFYALKQQTGQWCHATADRVDSQSRVIVANGKNTDVFLYQCTTVTALPSTGSGAAARIEPLDGGNGDLPAAAWLAMLATALLGAGWFVWRRAPGR